MLATDDNVRDKKAEGGIRSRFKSPTVTEDLPVKDETTGLAAMATLYPETSVFFADLSGFTAWSSTRSPCQVFTLLETLYGAFDMVAKRRKVFKVETIGDCYVAATGIPHFVKDHAVRMAKFAFDCAEQAALVTSQLTTQLGPETADLKLRIGIHSGPTTAGGK
jgi:class 3 adenylate cyclase